MKKYFAVLVVAVMLSGCAARPIHPGSPNQFDSSTYDYLVVTDSIITSTRTDLTNNAFPPNISATVKTALNNLIAAYNAADTAYKAYHAAALAGAATATQQADVSNALAQVNTATSNLTAAKGAK